MSVLHWELEPTQAMSMETTLTQAIWAISPLLVSSLAIMLSPAALRLLAGCSALISSVLLPTLPTHRDARQATTAAAAAPGRGYLLRAWPVYLISAAAMALLATAEIVVPALLRDRGLAVVWTGPILAAFSIASVAGGVVYGLRSWPGSLRIQSIALMILMSAGIATMGAANGLLLMMLGIIFGGLFKSGVMVTRNLSLRHFIPEPQLAAGVSVKYSAQGMGYSLSAVLVATILAHWPSSYAVYGGVLLTLVLTTASAMSELKSHSSVT